MKLRDGGALLKATYQQWNEHKSPRLAASLAYYTVFAIAPLLKFLPKAVVSWKDVRVGAVMTAVLFLIGQFLITLYLGKLNASSPYTDRIASA